MKQLGPMPPPLYQRISGSKYLRGRCSGCGEPIRIADPQDNVCSECNPHWSRLAKSSAPYHADIDLGGYSDTPINE